MKIINEDFQVHDSLNPLIWNSNNSLLPEVKEKILDIIVAFEDYIEVPINIVDIQLVGSNASYNYTENSDLDVHIIANYESVTEDTMILQMLYDAKKTSFNKNYDILIHSIEIEIYIQDIKSGIASNGIYSICDNKWVKEPKPITDVPNYNTTKAVNKWKQKINQALISNNEEEINNVINALYLLRHNSIATLGEYSFGNQVFKDIRSAGLLQDLKDKLTQLTSKRLSLESLMKK